MVTEGVIEFEIEAFEGHADDAGAEGVRFDVCAEEHAAEGEVAA